MANEGTEALFAGLLRLVPYSGIQFYDVEIPSSTAGEVRTWFTEELFEQDGLPHRILLPLERRTPLVGGDAALENAATRIVHPLTGRTVAPKNVLALDGHAALANFAGRWIPLPYLRFIGRDEAGLPRFDNGPTNWVRAWIAPPAVGAPAKVTLAFDTALERHSRLDTEIYAGPNSDDAAFGSTFMCVDTVDELGVVLGETWLDAWLAGPTSPPASVRFTEDASAAQEFRHAHIAQFLTLLRVFRQARIMPEVRFVDTLQRRFPVRSSAVDLVLDIGDNETTALLVDIDDVGIRAFESGFAEPLAVRDLSEPHVVHRGAMATGAEFSEAPFGDAMLSRDSGRHDAFRWPSLVRIGQEGRRLGLRKNGTEGITGLTNLRSFLLDGNTSPGVWRLSTDGETGVEHGPMVTGLALTFVGENGALLGARGEPGQGLLADARAKPAIRPRFSRASMLSFFTSELLLHAISQLNAAVRDTAGATDGVLRELRNIVVLAPPSFSEREREAFRDRVEAGVALTWRGLAWEQVPGAPQRPKVSLGIGGELGAQIAFLHDAVGTKYQGRFKDFARVHSRGGESAAETLRVASIDFGGRNTSLTVVDYSAGRDPQTAHEWLPSILMTERLPVGLDAVLQALVLERVLPAIERRLEACGLNPARHFLEEVTGRSLTGLLIDDPYFTRRFNRKVLWPAARGLMMFENRAALAASDGNNVVPLAVLVGLGGGDMTAASLALEAVALQAGALDFSLSSVSLRIPSAGLGQLTAREYAEPIAQLSKTVQSQICDLLLLGGEGMLHAALKDVVFAALPLPASRIVDLETHPIGAVSTALGANRHLAATLALPAIAAAHERRFNQSENGMGARALSSLSASRAPLSAGIGIPLLSTSDTRGLNATGSSVGGSGG